MVRMGRGETMSPGVLTWAMDQVAERYAQQDGQTLQAAGTAGSHCMQLLSGACSVHPFSTPWCGPRFRLCL